MKLVKIFSYTCKIGKISWILDIFTKLAKISDFCLFSWCWQNFRFYGSFYEIVKISWFVAQFHVCKQNSMFFFFVFMKFFCRLNFTICGTIYVYLLLWTKQHTIVFDFLYEVDKIWLFSWYFLILSYFYEVGKISWFLAIFMKLAKFHDFWLFSWSWQNFMIFSMNEVGKIWCFLFLWNY